MNSNGPTPVWTRSRNAQKYLVVDLASHPTPPPYQPQNIAPHLPSPAALASMVQNPGNTSGVIELFLDVYYKRSMPNKPSSVSLQPGKECGGWRSLIPQWIGQSPILDTAIRAMATCFIAAQYQDENLMNMGRDAYLSALQMVQRVLSEPNSAQRKDLLAATLVMSSTEQFLSNGGGRSQITHVEGGNRLLYFMIESPTTQSFEEIHLYVMNQGLSEALASRRPFLFSASTYRPSVRRLYSANPSYRSSLYFQWCELIVPLPNILHAVDNVAKAVASGSTPPQPDHILAIIEDLSIVEKNLAPWHESLKANTPGPWTFPTAVTGPNSVPFPLQFAGIEACALHCLHWTSQLLILDARNILTSLYPQSHLPVPAQDMQAQISEYASLICRSIQFCTQDASFAAAECIFLPLTVVKSYYGRVGDVERKKFCQGQFFRISEEQRIGFSIEMLESDY